MGCNKFSYTYWSPIFFSNPGCFCQCFWHSGLLLDIQVAKFLEDFWRSFCQDFVKSLNLTIHRTTRRDCLRKTFSAGRLDLGRIVCLTENSELKEIKKKETWMVIRLLYSIQYLKKHTCIYTYSIANESFFKGGEIMSFFPDRHGKHIVTRTRSSVPFWSPAGFHGVGSNTRPREVVAKFKKHDVVLAA